MPYIPDYKPISSTEKVAEVKSKKIKASREEQFVDSADRTDKIELSRNAQAVGDIKNILDKLPEIREDRVRELKKNINEGTYNVKGEKIAEKMIKEALLDRVV